MNRPRSLRTSGLLLLLAAAVAPFPGCGNDPPAGSTKASRPEEPLLTRAVRALGGRDALSAVRTLRIRSELSELGRRIDVTLHLQLPGRYRQDVETGDAHLVHATSGEDAWATLDGMRVPLELEEVQRLKEQIDLAQLSLLVGLESRQDLDVDEKGLEDGREWLAVRLGGLGAKTYRLGFDPKSALLTRAEWSTRVYGQGRDVEIALELSDYRPVGGIMVPYAGRILVGELEAARDVVKDVVVNPSLDEGLFAPPAANVAAPVQRRVVPEIDALVLRPLPGRAEDGERLLLAWMKDHEVQRNGPVFRLVEDSRPTAVGIPVVRPKTPSAPPEEKGPNFTREPRVEVLSTVVTPAKAEALADAEKRLLGEAATKELEAAGPFRHVLWNQDITQVQLPIRARPK